MTDESVGGGVEEGGFVRMCCVADVVVVVGEKVRMEKGRCLCGRGGRFGVVVVVVVRHGRYRLRPSRVT
jgi:hypothetical protein